jgi:hypothetical protein
MVAVRILRQIELIFGTKHSTTGRTRRARRTPSSVSDPFLHQVWKELRKEYYPDRPDLDSYIVAWSSRRQKRVLASCNVRQHRVVVARELFEPAAVRWIAPVLYHELCHAVLGEDVISASGRRLWHGVEFRALEARHPDIPALNMWIRSGGWAMAVRSHRARSAWRARKAQAVAG